MYKVLIVEDDPMVAMINEQYIKRCRDFQVEGVCRDGKSALEFLENNPADLVILDVYMPRVNGIDTLRRLREKKIPVNVIMVTAANDRDAIEECLHFGVVDYLVKPFTFERFQLALQKFSAQADALAGMETLSQQNIDRLIDMSVRKDSEEYPKGNQKKTLSLILSHLMDNGEAWTSGDELAQKTGLTGVTVRRYMNYLLETGRVAGRMDYGTGGRPCMLYRIR